MGPVEYDAEKNCFTASYRASRDSTSLAVVSIVATAQGNDPVDMPPLGSVIDTTALEELFATAPDGRSRIGDVSFQYAGFDVRVYSDGRIEAARTGTGVDVS